MFLHGLHGCSHEHGNPCLVRYFCVISYLVHHFGLQQFLQLIFPGKSARTIATYGIDSAPCR